MSIIESQGSFYEHKTITDAITVENIVDNKRIAKNTALMYDQMLPPMAIELFTIQAILSSLGVK